MRFSSRIGEIQFSLGRNAVGPEQWQEDIEGWNTEKVLAKTGVEQTWICDNDETALDLALAATQQLSGLGSVDTLVYVSQSNDYFLPNSASVLHGKLGLDRTCKSFDVNLGCSGFVYALWLVTALQATNQSSQALIVCADTYSKFIDAGDRTSRPLFSDAASATIVEACSDGPSSIGPFALGTDGEGFDALIVRGGSARGKFAGTDAVLDMNGSRVFLFTMSTVYDSIVEFMAQQEIGADGIDKFFFHQASKLVLDQLESKLELEPAKVYRGLSQIGNTVSSSLPIALRQARDSGALARGDKLLLSGFGVGLSWANCLVEW